MQSAPLPQADRAMSPAELERLRFYRDEVKHEFGLLAMRTTILVTCQSFLIVPFAILSAAGNFRPVVLPSIFVALLGLYTAWIIREPIEATHRAIAEWLQKQRALLAGVASDDYKTSRDRLAGAAESTSRDTDHERSLAFSKQAPVAFVVFWWAALGWIFVRAAVGF